MSDYMVRAMAADAQIRAFAATTRELVEEMRQIHNTSPVVTAALGRLLTGSVMMGSMLKGEEDLLTIQVKGDGPLQGMTVTADGEGNVKGYANEPQVILPANAAGKLDVGGAVGNGYLSVIKDMGLKEPYIGQTALQTGEIADDLTYYFVTSEQVPSSVGLGVLMERDNTVKQAGGFILQLMPFATEEVIRTLEDNLSKFSSVTAALDAGNTPEQMLQMLLGNLDVQVTDTMGVRYACNCSKERVHRAIVSIGKKDIQEMIEEGKEVEVNCHFCNKRYSFSVDELEKMLD
ncbi:molecular chaperone Hsp33 [Kineothrix alysoides]|uniref:33 kDa chaperonin n=1 Tax=Kineothrix alysoides TaxID=1469948 RepID=A0A4R1R4B1_9FIRM|nr:Hsp33 family molecular chaperone HslO [Kineothrix alysoides]TCL60326.1 molecular chaperone Hsp33 [Kineothrix alysoides]